MTNKNKLNEIKILVVTNSKPSSQSATGQFIWKLFENFSQDNIRWIYVSEFDSTMNRNMFQLSADSAQNKAILDDCKDFSPDLCYFYLINNQKLLEFQLEVADQIHCPYIIHIMDDWMELAKIKNNWQYLAVKPLVQSLIWNATLRYAISHQMANEMYSRFGFKFDILSNCITEEELPDYFLVSSKQPLHGLHIKYSGALAPNMTLQSVKDVALVVSSMADHLDISFTVISSAHYISNIKKWESKYRNVKIRQLSSSDNYPAGLSGANLLLLAYNFDDVSQAYTRLSFSNKMIEYLATGVPILAYGPSTATSIEFLKSHNAAHIVDNRNKEELRAVLHKHYMKIESTGMYTEKVPEIIRQLYFSKDSLMSKFEKKIISTVADKKMNENKRYYLPRQVAVVLGNGPSLRDFDFKANLSGVATFGLNAAYRHWDKIDWYPDYYACLDLVVGLSHSKEIIRLITNAQQYGIKQFLLRNNLIETMGELQNSPLIVNYDKISGIHPYLSNNKYITTGSHTCAWVASLGFTEIVLLGMDFSYVSVIPQAQSIGDWKLEIVETPQSNPNYFFDDYQRKGDKYYFPFARLENPAQSKCWETTEKLLSDDNIIVMNANMASKVTSFHKMAFEDWPAWMSQHNKAVKFYDNFSRRQHAVLNEDALFLDYMGYKSGTMIEVGAHFGNGTKAHLERGWKVYAFESDDANRAKCVTNTSSHAANLTLDERVVSDVSGQVLPFYDSPDSTDSKSVTTVTLADYIEEHSISQVDYLKIGAQEFAFIVLKGFPFNKIKPQFIMCKFEDLETASLGYTMMDMANFLVEKGYHVYVSEWHPKIQVGEVHAWRRFFEYPAPTASCSAWGNLLAFKEKPFEGVLQLLLDQHV